MSVDDAPVVLFNNSFLNKKFPHEEEECGSRNAYINLSEHVPNVIKISHIPCILYTKQYRCYNGRISDVHFKMLIEMCDFLKEFRLSEKNNEWTLSKV